MKDTSLRGIFFTIIFLDDFIAFSCLFVANYINGRLNEPEIYNLEYSTEERVFETDKKIPNDNYLRGSKRVVLKLLMISF